MKKEDLYNGITHIDDSLIEEAYAHRKKVQKNKRALLLITAAAVFVILAGVLLFPFGGALPVIESYALQEAVYPTRLQYPKLDDFTMDNNETDWNTYNAALDDWLEERRSLSMDTTVKNSMQTYLKRSIPAFLSNASKENRVFSPLNVYMALSMLAELSDGSGNQQILDLIGVSNMDTIRANASTLWNATYYKDGLTSSLLASSLWLNESMSVKDATLQTLASNYYASSYQGKMGSADFNQALRDWLNKNTDGLLKDTVAGVEMSPETVVNIASTVTYNAKWSTPFSSSLTRAGVFHTVDRDVQHEFMHSSSSAPYYWGNGFTATALHFNAGGAMYFILPDENSDVNELLSNSQTMEFMLSGQNWKHQKQVTVNLAVPKFDVSSQIDLKDSLNALGVTDIFNPLTADFSPLTDASENIFVTSANHAARVTIDEDGCSAAAFTLLESGTGGPPPEKVDFMLNRPFIFCITDRNELPLFVGIVNQP